MPGATLFYPKSPQLRMTSVGVVITELGPTTITNFMARAAITVVGRFIEIVKSTDRANII